MEGYMRLLSKGPSLPGLEREEGVRPYTSSLELCALGRTRLIPVRFMPPLGEPRGSTMRHPLTRINPTLRRLRCEALFEE